MPSNPLDRLAAYFKPCTRPFVQEDYNNLEDTFAELQKKQHNPLDNLSAFFKPITKKFEESDYYNDE
ncbi:868_t:CDS:1, partial [Funneliformis mosseae]